MKRLVFKCNTHFQMMNAINIKMQLYPNNVADLYLDDATEFGEVLEKLRQKNIFRKIEYLPIQEQIDFYINSSPENRKLIIHNIDKYLDIKIESGYDDCFFGLDNVSNKLFYYYLLSMGQRPNVHLFEEGTTSFVRSYAGSALGDGMPHKDFGEKSFLNKVCEQLFYEPDLYAANENAILATNPKPSEEVKKVYASIYPKVNMPKERFIFFEEAFLKENYSSNDAELLDSFAEIVGKKNIIVKLHPRTVVDRFSFKGYKVWTDSTVPWEIGLLNGKIEEKVLVSVFSTSTITGKYLYDIDGCVIHLNKLFSGNYPLFKYKAFGMFRKKLYDKYNSEEIKFFYAPSTVEELKEQVLYINGVFKSNG